MRTRIQRLSGSQKRRFYKKKKCRFCGKFFRGPGKKYCSLKCFKQFEKENRQGVRLTIACETCKKSFKRYPSQMKGGSSYCSPACRNEGKRRGEYRTCRVCGDKFYARPDHVRKDEGKYCTKSCYLMVLSASPPGRIKKYTNALLRSFMEPSDTCQYPGCCEIVYQGKRIKDSWFLCHLHRTSVRSSLRTLARKRENHIVVSLKPHEEGLYATHV